MNNDQYVPQAVETAKDLAIEEVQDCRRGEIICVNSSLPQDRESLHEKRREIEKAYQDKNPLYLCAICSRPVYLALASKIKRSGLHFRHYVDDGNCSAKTRNGKTKEQIEALKYDGLKEGPLHRETKELLVASLKVDPDFSDVAAEKRWVSKDGEKWKQPDVQALYKGKPVVFEIQLATTFLSVIESRSRFYLNERVRLIWVFRSFKTENRSASIDDIYFGNNRNAFLVSPNTRNASIKAGRMLMQCYWPQPELSANQIVENWNEQLVPFTDIQTDKTGREWFYDCDKRRRDLRCRILKQDVRDYCAGFKTYTPVEQQQRWENLLRDAVALGFNLGKEHCFRKLMSAILSLEEGKPIGFGHRTLISVAHYIHDKHESIMFYFLHAENAYGRRESLRSAGKPGLWEQRRKDAIGQMKRGAPFEPDRTHDRLVTTLFPEVGEMISAAKNRKR